MVVAYLYSQYYYYEKNHTSYYEGTGS